MNAVSRRNCFIDMLGKVDGELAFAAVFLSHNTHALFGVLGEIDTQTNDVMCRSGNGLCCFLRQFCGGSIALLVRHPNCQICHVCKMQVQCFCRNNMLFLRCQYADVLGVSL